MKVVLLGDMSGTRAGKEWPPRGSVIDLPDDEAQMLCSGGMVRAVAPDSPKVEVAVPRTDDVRAAVPVTTDSASAVGQVARPKRA